MERSSCGTGSSTTTEKKHPAQGSHIRARTLRSEWWKKAGSSWCTPGGPSRKSQSLRNSGHPRQRWQMAVDILPVQSDPTLLADIRRYGKFDPTGCYQCGSCTISCDLVSDFASFPRKSIRYALLGLRAPLLGDLEPWICHDCGDCSIVCPRQAEPRISMATLRRFLSGQYERTGMASKLLTSRAWYFGSLAFAAVLVVLLILCYHLWYVGLPFSGLATPLGMEHMFPTMTYFTLAVMLFPLLLLLSRVHRVWRLTMGGQQ